MSKVYHNLSKKASSDLAKLLAANGQVILPMVELIEESRMAVDDLIETLGRATVEAVLRISAAGVAGENHQGRRGASSRQPGRSREPLEQEDAGREAEASESRQGIRQGDRSSGVWGYARRRAARGQDPLGDDAGAFDEELRGDPA